MKQKRILLGISGSVAIYKSAELVRRFVQAGSTVTVVMTDSAVQLISPVLFQALSGATVYQSLWQPSSLDGMAHVSLSKAADAVLIAPATANLIAKIAHGIADDLLTTVVAAVACPLLIAPAMNRRMWENPANQRNIAQLKSEGIAVLGPDVGKQACGEEGEGRMLEPEALFDHIDAFFQPKFLIGKTVLVTAGPTFELIDAVRGMSTRSSGKMGFALARAASDAGATVTVITGPVEQKTPLGCQRIDVMSAKDMQAAVELAFSMQTIDVFIAAAAVSDYYAVHRCPHKMEKKETLELQLKANPDILAWVASRPNPPFCVGFAAESHDLLKRAQEKRVRKHLPLLVANLVPQAFCSDDNDVLLLDEDGVHPISKSSKVTIARQILRHVTGLIKKRESGACE